MEFAEALDLGRHAFMMALMTAAPILAMGLGVGLVISFIQAVTQLQEQTLTFVPKIAAMVVAAIRKSFTDVPETVADDVQAFIDDLVERGFLGYEVSS